MSESVTRPKLIIKLNSFDKYPPNSSDEEMSRSCEEIPITIDSLPNFDERR